MMALRLVSDAMGFARAQPILHLPPRSHLTQLGEVFLAEFGRFIEIGKKDIYANSPLPMRPLARNVAFFALDMDELLAQRPDVGGTLLRETVSQVVAGSLPPLPVTTFALGEAERAFRMMAQARHVGKIVLEISY